VGAGTGKGISFWTPKLVGIVHRGAFFPATGAFLVRVVSVVLVTVKPLLSQASVRRYVADRFPFAIRPLAGLHDLDEFSVPQTIGSQPNNPSL
jgi:hypothetical protein